MLAASIWSKVRWAVLRGKRGEEDLRRSSLPRAKPLGPGFSPAGGWGLGDTKTKVNGGGGGEKRKSYVETGVGEGRLSEQA